MCYLRRKGTPLLRNRQMIIHKNTYNNSFILISLQENRNNTNMEQEENKKKRIPKATRKKDRINTKEP